MSAARPPHRIDRDRLEEMWTRGDTVADMAASLGCTAYGVYAVVYREGLAYRRQGKRGVRRPLAARQNRRDWLAQAENELFPGRSYGSLTKAERCAAVDQARQLLRGAT